MASLLLMCVLLATQAVVVIEADVYYQVCTSMCHTDFMTCLQKDNCRRPKWPRLAQRKSKTYIMASNDDDQPINVGGKHINQSNYIKSLVNIESNSTQDARLDWLSPEVSH
ncbi:hypothetical protein LSAT2_032228 [Lamellibrachia satsuma]|nr:hypothetical protein LSAT2_032228 [Lamellibrachia satsuma]